MASMKYEENKWIGCDICGDTCCGKADHDTIAEARECAKKSGIKKVKNQDVCSVCRQRNGVMDNDK